MVEYFLTIKIMISKTNDMKKVFILLSEKNCRAYHFLPIWRPPPKKYGSSSLKDRKKKDKIVIFKCFFCMNYYKEFSFYLKKFEEQKIINYIMRKTDVLKKDLY